MVFVMHSKDLKIWQSRCFFRSRRLACSQRLAVRKSWWCSCVAQSKTCNLVVDRLVQTRTRQYAYVSEDSSVLTWCWFVLLKFSRSEACVVGAGLVWSRVRWQQPVNKRAVVAVVCQACADWLKRHSSIAGNRGMFWTWGRPSFEGGCVRDFTIR